jgi:hypothetical protein
VQISNDVTLSKKTYKIKRNTIWKSSRAKGESVSSEFFSSSQMPEGAWKDPKE